MTTSPDPTTAFTRPGADDPALAPNAPTPVVNGLAVTTKLGRFLAVTAVASPANLGLYALVLAVTDWPAVAANLLAAVAIAVPAFAACRWWVWEAAGAYALRRDVATYLASTGANIAASSAAAAALDRAGASDGVLVIGTLATYTVLWLARFALLDLVFSRR